MVSRCRILNPVRRHQVDISLKWIKMYIISQFVYQFRWSSFFAQIINRDDLSSKQNGAFPRVYKRKVRLLETSEKWEQLTSLIHLLIENRHAFRKVIVCGRFAGCGDRRSTRKTPLSTSFASLSRFESASGRVRTRSMAKKRYWESKASERQSAHRNWTGAEAVVETGTETGTQVSPPILPPSSENPNYNHYHSDHSYHQFHHRSISCSVHRARCSFASKPIDCCIISFNKLDCSEVTFGFLFLFPRFFEAQPIELKTKTPIRVCHCLLSSH